MTVPASLIFWVHSRICGQTFIQEPLHSLNNIGTEKYKVKSHLAIHTGQIQVHNKFIKVLHYDHENRMWL